MAKKALITGVTGQDGSYLSEFLLEKGYEVHGIIRRSSVDFRERIAHLEGHPNFHLHYADMGDSMSLVKVVDKVKPDEIYNLAAQSHVQVSFDSPEFTADVDATGVLRILEAVRTNHLEKTCPEIVREVMRVLPLQKLTDVLQRLVSEGISVRDLKCIMQCLIEWGQKEKDAVLLVEYVRSSLSRYISYKFSGGQNIVAAYLLDPALEEKIRKSVRQTSSGSYLAMDPATVRAILGVVKRTIGDLAKIPQKPVIIVSVDIRRYFRKMIEKDWYELPVLSFQELSAEINIQPLGRLKL